MALLSTDDGWKVAPPTWLCRGTGGGVQCSCLVSHRPVQYRDSRGRGKLPCTVDPVAPSALEDVHDQVRHRASDDGAHSEEAVMAGAKGGVVRCHVEWNYRDLQYLLPPTMSRSSPVVQSPLNGRRHWCAAVGHAPPSLCLSPAFNIGQRHPTWPPRLPNHVRLAAPPSIPSIVESRHPEIKRANSRELAYYHVKKKGKGALDSLECDERREEATVLSDWAKHPPKRKKSVEMPAGEPFPQGAPKCGRDP